jgi:hypothetical protein
MKKLLYFYCFSYFCHLFSYAENMITILPDTINRIIQRKIVQRPKRRKRKKMRMEYDADGLLGPWRVYLTMRPWFSIRSTYNIYYFGDGSTYPDICILFMQRPLTPQNNMAFFVFFMILIFNSQTSTFD